MHLKFGLSLLTVGVIVVSAKLLNYPESTLHVIYVLSIGLIFQILYMTLISVYKSLEKMFVVALFSVTFRVITAIMIVGSIYFGMGLMGIIWTFMLGNALIFLAACVYFYKDYKIFYIKVNINKWVSLIAGGIPFYLSALLSMVYFKINIIILSKMQGELEIGYYMAAATLVETLYFVPEAVTTSIYPAFSRIYGISIEALKKTYSKMMKYVIIITVAVCVGCILVGDKILLLIYGERFQNSVQILNILILWWVFMFISTIMSTLLFAINKEKYQVRVMGIACVINVVLSVSMIGNYGFIGAAYALTITEATTILILAFILWQNHIMYIPDWTIARLAGVLLAMVFTVKALSNVHVVVEIAAGAITYLAFLFIMRIFDSEDLVYIKSFVKRGAKYL